METYITTKKEQGKRNLKRTVTPVELRIERKLTKKANESTQRSSMKKRKKIIGLDSYEVDIE